MSYLHLLILALIQGITEFLPISSSGHLILLPTLTTLPDQGHLMDVAVHVGTLMAVLIYFWRDTKGLSLAAIAVLGIRPARQALAKQKAYHGTDYTKLFWALVIATLPIIIFGSLLVKSGMVDLLRTAEVIAATSIIFGLLLYVGDRRIVSRSLGTLGVKSALMIGVSQIIALIPGTSRSGITMTTARFLGFDRETAARFSMLLSIPTILAAGVLGTLSIIEKGEAFIVTDALIGAGLSFVFALMAIHFLMRWLATKSMTLFVVYRVALGLVLFALLGMGIL